MSRESRELYAFAVVIVRHPNGKYLAVEETRNRGWWLPAGLVEPHETFEEGAIRETKEEGGVDVKLDGILRVEFTPGAVARMRVVYLASPIDPDQPPKSVPDSESVSARWVTLEEFAQFGTRRPGIRGKELLDFGQYLENGGQVYPLSLFGDEHTRPIANPQARSFTVSSPHDAERKTQDSQPQTR